MDWRQILVLLLIFVPLERLLPLRPNQGLFRRDWTTDSVYLIVNGFLIRFLFVGVLLLALPLFEHSGLSGVQAFTGELPLWLQIPLAILIADLGFYVHHRLFHAIPALWKFHAVHHSIEQLDWLAAHRVHPVDQIASNSLSLLPIFALGFSAEAMTFHAIAFFLQAHLVHANTRMRFGPLEWLFASPRFHHWHHADHQAAHDRNFGGQTLVWDRIFGTVYMPSTFPERYGAGDNAPTGYLQQLAWPFLRLLSKKRTLA